MRIKDPVNEGEEPFNLVPLTDMVFNLLIFFMAATTFTQIEKDLAVQLPQSGGFRTLSERPPQLTINIREDGGTWVNGVRKEPAELENLLASAVKENAEREVIIRADERGYIKSYASVTAMCRRVGLKQHKIAFLEGGGS